MAQKNWDLFFPLTKPYDKYGVLLGIQFQKRIQKKLDKDEESEKE